MPKAKPGNIAAVVVLFSPDDAAPRNAAALAAQVDRVFVVDNTPSPDPAIVSAIGDIHNVEYVPLGANTGIAAALNVGVEHADAAGYEWALTMDQDSTPPRNMAARLLACARECAGHASVGIITPLHRMENAPAPQPFEGCRPALTVITSGNLLSVAAWRSVGGFDPTLFIDGVDHDMCLRLTSAGYAVAVCGTTTIDHRIGDMAARRLWRSVYVSNHPPVRRYYITRNRLLLLSRYAKQYPEFARSERRALVGELIKMLLFETQRCDKVRMMWRGWRDYRHGVSGPYPG